MGGRHVQASLYMSASTYFLLVFRENLVECFGKAEKKRKVTPASIEAGVTGYKPLRPEGCEFVTLG